jgi:hypothetical protein
MGIEPLGIEPMEPSNMFALTPLVFCGKRSLNASKAAR